LASGGGDLGPEHGHEVGREGQADVDLAHVEHAPVGAHDAVVVAEREEEAAGGGVAREGGDGGHGEGEEVGGDGAERVHELPELGAGGARPPDVQPVGEEAALGDGDQGGSRAGFVGLGRGGGDGGERGADRGDERVA